MVFTPNIPLRNHNYNMQGALELLALILFLVTSSCDAFLSFDSKIKNEVRGHELRTVSSDRSQSRRWNGNYKTISKRLADIPKKKKMKLDLVANGVKKTVDKKRQETLQHVLTKAIIWKLFMDEYPNLEIEYDIGDPEYLPDGEFSMYQSEKVCFVQLMNGKWSMPARREKLDCGARPGE